ncbi:endonuclease/exonuclease/phosphatase family domain-containing protein 1-like [Diorhabda carinulata]|uniref:endonuclease/exonuclease/phosphatase family domain-containing protein 1-like n=1 Tax=Diorhabda carinulata TaxID=1163345 RepID=UPI0025A1F82B|nr:endonuclease/exonuclease/phosphatase family domain-containing protein 1-like [Diorhabda carinulata]
MVQNAVKMGQNSSLPKGRRRSLRSFMKKTHSKPKSLSHTFSLSENDDRIDRLNINIASEEELMTLDGVNREIARSIVEHRKAIGRFRKIEDLAVVRGIGADRLQKLKPEICVSSRRSLSYTSSRAQSYDSLKSYESRLTVRSNKLVNVNKASVFELQTINGVTQEIAAAIVHHRTKKGKFRQIEDMIKVKCIDNIRLASIGRYLTTQNDDDDISELEESRPSILTNGYTMPNQRSFRTDGMPQKLPIRNGLSNSRAIDIFELLSAYSPRPVVKEIFNFSRNGEPAVRVASWNLHEFSYEKVGNLGVKEVVCRIILENGFSIIAIQDVLNVTALRLICDELNNPKLQRVKEWNQNNHHNWNFCMLDIHDSKLGFIYDSDGGVPIDLLSLNEGPSDTKTECEALVASFRVGNINLQLVNLMLHKSTNIDFLDQKFKELTSESDLLLVFIDFTGIRTMTDDYCTIGNLKAAFSTNTNTTFVNPIPGSNAHTANILYNSKMGKQLTGMTSVIKQGLIHLAIPNGWSWGGPASPYCPLYAELYTNSTSDIVL